MHYITGTSFAVKRHANSWDSKFKLNETYVISGIVISNQGLKYTFSSRFDRVEIIFESGRQADGFIASHRRESVPDYESVYQKNTAL